MSEEPQVTRAEFTTLQNEVVRTFSEMRAEMKQNHEHTNRIVERMAEDSKDAMERIHKSTRPNVVLWLMLAGVALSVIVAVGGLVGYGFRREIDHSQNATMRNSMWIDHYIKSDLAELYDRRREDRSFRQRVLDEHPTNGNAHQHGP